MSTPITVTGNLTDDPELRFTSNGRAVARFTVAVNVRIRQADGTWADGETSFYPVAAWGPLAEQVAESLARGARVIVTGRMMQRHWTTPDTNERRSAWQITADDIGASLMFATVQVRKSARRGNGDVPPDDEWNSATRNRPTSGAPVPPPPADDSPDPESVGF